MCKLLGKKFEESGVAGLALKRFTEVAEEQAGSGDELSRKYVECFKRLRGDLGETVAAAACLEAIHGAYGAQSDLWAAGVAAIAASRLKKDRIRKRDALKYKLFGKRELDRCGKKYAPRAMPLI